MTGSPLPPTAPVVVVGAGPTGMTAAALLAHYGVPVLVVDRFPAAYPLPRAVHLDDEVLRILQRIGLAEAFRRISRPGLGLRLLDRRYRVMAEFRRDPGGGAYGYPEANMFDQPDLDRLLRDHLAASPLVRLAGGVEVTGLADDSGGTRLTCRTTGAIHTVTARFVLACDGADSTVRRLVGTGLADFGFAQRWLVVDTVGDVDGDVWDGVHQVCDPDRAATFMRVGERRYRYETRLPDTGVADDVTTLLAPWLTARERAGMRVLRRAEYTFTATVAARWRHGGVFLLGDAAHRTPPFIGQGLGAGLRDAANLAWKLAAVLGDETARPGGTGQPGIGADTLPPLGAGALLGVGTGALPPVGAGALLGVGTGALPPVGAGARLGVGADALLDTYEAERRPHAVAQIRLAVTAGRAMTGGRAAAAVLRRVALALAGRVPGAGRLVLRSTSPVLTRGPLVRRRRPWDRAGRLCPQPHLRYDGRVQRLDDVLGDGFAVLAARPVTGTDRRAAAALRARVVELSPAEPTHRSLRRWLRGGAVVVRPDRTVAGDIRAFAPERAN